MKMKKYICLIAAVCLLGTAAFCGYHIYDHYAHEAEQTEADVYKRQVQAIGLALLVLFFVIGVMKTCGSFAEVKKPEHLSLIHIFYAGGKKIRRPLLRPCGQRKQRP